MVSKYMSYIAISDSDRDGSKLDNRWVIQTRYVPSQLARGWHGSQLDSGGSIAGVIAGVLQRDSKFDSSFDSQVRLRSGALLLRCSRTNSLGSSRSLPNPFLSFFKTKSKDSHSSFRGNIPMDLDSSMTCRRPRRVENTVLSAPPLATQSIQVLNVRP